MMELRNMPLIALMTVSPVFADSVAVPCEQNTNRSLLSFFASVAIGRAEINQSDACNPVQELNTGYLSDQLADEDYRRTVETLITSEKEAGEIVIIDPVLLPNNISIKDRSGSDPNQSLDTIEGFNTINQ